MNIYIIVFLLGTVGTVFVISLAARNEMSTSQLRVGNWVSLISGMCFAFSLAWILYSTQTALNLKSKDWVSIQELKDGPTTIQVIVVDGKFVKVYQIINGYIDPKQHGVWVIKYYDCNYWLCYERDNEYRIDKLVEKTL